MHLPDEDEEDPLLVSGRGLALVEALATAWAAEHGAKEVHLLPYHRLGEVKYHRLGRTYLFDGRTPDEAELHWVASLIEGYGLPVQIGG